MIEIRTFDGEAGELAMFSQRVWRQAYEGRMMIMLWSEELFRRDLFPEDDSCRDYLIAAYDGTTLVGSHPSKPLTIRLHGQETSATWGSFLSVDHNYRRRGVALQLQQEWARRHRERGARVNLGYQYVASPHALGPKFWLRQPEANPIIRKLGFWVRAFDHAAVARSELRRLEAWGSRILSLVQGPPQPPLNGTGIRPYRPTDLDACHQLISRAGASADLAYLWQPAILQRQLQFDNLSDTVVMERNGLVAGLVNYNLIDALGKSAISLGMIEILAFGDLRAADRRRLLAAALCRMRAGGAQAAMMLRSSPYGRDTLFAAGFLPTPTQLYFIGARFNDHLRLDGVRQMQVLMR